MPPELREALENAITQSEATSQNADAPAESLVPDKPAAPSVEAAPAEPTDSEKPADGAAEKPGAEPTPTEKPEGTPGEPAEGKPAATERPSAEERAAHRIDRPPTSWKKEAKGEWAALPVHIRQEVHRREAEINRVLAQSAPDRRLAEQFKQVVSPFMAIMQERNIDPVTATRNLFEADMKLSTGTNQSRAAYLAELIRDYDIDILELDSAIARSRSSQPQAQPDLTVLIQQQLQQALAPIMEERTQARERAQQAVEQTIEQMSLDPRYPYFEDVLEDMADLMDLAVRKNVPLTLDEAYNKAVRMNPDTFGQLQAASTMNTATQQHQAALRAKAAAASITGAPASGGGQSNVGDGSLRGAIEAAFGGQRL